MTRTLPEIEDEANGFSKKFCDCLKTKGSFNEAKSLYFEDVKLRIKSTYEEYLHSNAPTNWTLAALHVVLFESIKFFEEILKYSDNVKTKTLFLHCCSCLNKNNVIIYGYFLKSYDVSFIKIKRHLLKQFLWENLKVESTNFETLLYLRFCAIQFGNHSLISLAKKSMFAHCCWKPSYNCLSFQPKSQILVKVECDGKICQKAQDPPGQHSVYIPPGDTSQEKYRIITFLNFPNYSPADCRLLAKAGFYYTGYKDRVKCFCCGMTVQNWATDDDVTASRWHEHSCKMMKGEECGNVFMAEEFSRFTSPRNSPSSLSSEQNMPRQTAISPTPTNNTFRGGHGTSNVPAGLILMGEQGNTPESQRPMDPGGRRGIDLATIPSADHENLIRSLDLYREADRL